MFGNKKKPDSKVRFQTPRFRQRLQLARTYKRPKKNLPQTKSGVWLAKLGLDSLASKLISLAVFLFLIYFVYFPNIFSINNVIVNGATAENLPNVQQLTGSYLSKRLPWPQNNLLLLSKSGLSSYLLKNDEKISGINSVVKKLPGTLVININPRIDSFAVFASTTPNSYFTVSNDGKVTGENEIDASATITSGLTQIKLTGNDYIYAGQDIFSASDLSFIQALLSQIPIIEQTSIDYLEMPSLQTSIITVYTKNGPKLLFDMSEGSGQAMARLKTVLSQFGPAGIKKIAYLDLRFKDRGYLCYINTPCDSPLVIPEATTTPTD